MNHLSKEWISFLREQYPVGSRIRLREMNDPYHPVPPGTRGTLKHIDDLGTFHVQWDNGSSLGLVVGEDTFSVLPPEQNTLKLYMPLNADLYERNEYGDWEEDPLPVSGRGLTSYAAQISKALVQEQTPEEHRRGIMHWYPEDDTVAQKVESVVFTVENRDHQLWGVAECSVLGELTPNELDTLKEYITGQASDGWGEGFEQRGICVDDAELYVHLWDCDNWSIQTEQECFSPEPAQGLPPLCFSVLHSTGELICLKKGESGYYHSEHSTADKAENVERADILNEQLGVTPEQRQAMEIGSMFGWDVPGADPENYGGHASHMGGMQLEL